MLSTSAYAPLQKDPTGKIQNTINRALSIIFKEHPDSRSLYLRLICRNGSAPALYGLPKIHKPEVPLRPIVDFTTSPLRAVSAYLHQLISPLTGTTDTYLRDSSHFIDLVKGLKVNADESLVSFDVVSLFTSVPVPLALSVARTALSADSGLAERTCLSVDEICRLLELCLSSTYFSFNGRFYKQTSGTAMGAAISVTMANLTMEYIEQKALSCFNPKPKTFLRYVDDCFCIVEASEVERLCQCLNTVEPSIQFTLERETDGVLPFLDVSVRRASDALNFAVYRKPTHTGRYLDFESYHPTSHKASVVSALFRRALSVCSTEEALREEVKKIKADLVNNGYPKRFINDIYKRLRRPPMTPTSRPSNRICLPYVKNVSETVGRVLRKHGIAVSHKPVSTIRRRLPPPKDRPGRERAQGLVYRVPCADCPVAYVGETKNFPDRIRRHKYDVRKKDIEASALAEHEQKTGHSFSLDETQIVATEGHWRKRLHLESWFIQMTSKNVNRSKGTLPSAYLSGLRALWGKP
ncbi:uncharacterized protein ISCGN_024562 [Ixodes scapularis]